ncbi:MAG: glycosyltransferase [Candidatus Zixiibacteriota bacterium]|nr:MAG: glycosyltransferase [candidate division Zixibacteria bacterium]
MSGSKKICLITNRYPAHPDDVASPFVRDFHLRLKERGIEVSVFTPFYEAERSEYSDQVVRFQWGGGTKVVGALNLFSPKEVSQLLSFLKEGKRQLFEHLERTRPDRCLALWALPSGWLARQAKMELGIPYSVWCLGSDIYVWAKKPFLRGITRRVLRRAEHLFADGFDLKERTERLSGRSCSFLPSMRRLPQAADEKVRLDPAKFNLLYLGRWEKKKGIDDLIKAVSFVKGKLPSVRLHVLGWGSFETKMRELIGRLGLGHEVKIVGKVSAQLVASYIKAADCVIIPSKGDSIPLVFSEALQMGTPLIVTNVGDMGHLTRKFGLGKAVPSGSTKRLARAMIEFACEKKDYTGNMPEALRLLDIDRAVDDYLRITGQGERSYASVVPALSKQSPPAVHDPRRT